MSSLEGSLDKEDRLLAQALADALEQDIAEVPDREHLQGLHHFSETFEKQMQQLIGEITADQDTNDKKEKTEKVVAVPIPWGRIARRYGTWAAALVCVIGLGYLAAGPSGFLRMGSAMKDSAPMTEESTAESAPADAFAEEAAEETGYAEMPMKPEIDSAEEDFDDSVNDGVEAPAADPGEGSASEIENEELMTAPDWQEQLLAESVKAEQLAKWNFVQLCPDNTFELSTEVQPVTPEVPDIRVSDIYEVYYQSEDGWQRIYQGPIGYRKCSDHVATYWPTSYALDEYGLTRPGIYRLVRIVNQYRQALDVEITSK